MCPHVFIPKKYTQSDQKPKRGSIRHSIDHFNLSLVAFQNMVCVFLLGIIAENFRGLKRQNFGKITLLLTWKANSLLLHYKHTIFSRTQYCFNWQLYTRIPTKLTAFSFLFKEQCQNMSNEHWITSPEFKHRLFVDRGDKKYLEKGQFSGNDKVVILKTKQKKDMT